MVQRVTLQRGAVRGGKGAEPDLHRYSYLLPDRNIPDLLGRIYHRGSALRVHVPHTPNTGAGHTAARSNKLRDVLYGGYVTY